MIEAQKENRCGDCKHWHANPADPMNLAAPRTGVCRAVPPTPLMVGQRNTVQGLQMQVDFVYPQLLANALGCGMYQERLELTIKN